MARILLGWEFGAGRGHAVILKSIAVALAKRGHEAVLAVKNVELFAEAGIPVWQAPVSPRLLIDVAREPGLPPSTMGDILARLGSDDPAIVAMLVLAWKRLLGAIEADAVIADFAPFLLSAARGNCPAMLIGTGFGTPPADMAGFPSLTGAPAALDERETLASANRGLERAGAKPLPSLPSIFAADIAVASTFAELDPYCGQRTAPVRPPPLMAESGSVEAGGGEEVFVYLPESVPAPAPIWEGLAKSRLPVRIHLPNASAAHLRMFRDMGFEAEPQPLPWAAIAERSRLLLSHGGHGFVCSGLLAGLPQVICHYDLEKRLNGNAIAALGLGGHVPLHGIVPDAFAASLVQLHSDSDLADRARASAPGFRSRGTRAIEDIVADEIEGLL